MSDNTTAPAEIPNPYGMDFAGQTAGLAAKLGLTSAPQETPAPEPTPTPEPVVEPPVVQAEPVTDTPAAPVTDTPAPAATETKPWFQEPKTYPGEDTPAPVAQQPAAPAENPYKEIEPLLADPEIKMILELKKAGKSIKDYAEQIRVVDFKAMTPEQLLAYEMQKYGAPQASIDAKLEEYAEMEAWEKNKDAETRRAQLEAEQTYRVSAFTNNIKQEHERSSQEQAAYEADALRKRDAIINDMVGKEYKGFVQTEREAKALRYRFEHGFPELYYKKADGTPDYNRIDPEAFAEFARRYDFLEGIVQANASKNFNNGKEAILEKVTNPSRGEQGAPPNTDVDPRQAMQAVATDFFKAPF